MDKYPEESFQICFTVLKNVEFGKAVYICGSHPNLGNWNRLRATKMTWTEDNYWHTKILFSSKTSFEYKYFISDDTMTKNSAVQWENSKNRTIKNKNACKFFLSVEVNFESKGQRTFGRHSKFAFGS